MNKPLSTITDDRRAEARSDLRQRMAIQQQVERAMNGLIQGMVKLVDDQSQVAESRMEKHQIKNLLNVALETPSVEVVKHYILYQVGRDVSGTGWRYHDFGKKLLEAIDGLKTNADSITRQAHRDLRLTDPTPVQVDEAWMLLVRAYLGQLNRYFYYRKEARQWPQTAN